MSAFLIDCAEHGRRPWYLLCVHVQRGARIFVFEKATRRNVGTAICQACDEQIKAAEAAKEKPNIDHLMSACDRCCEAILKRKE